MKPRFTYLIIWGVKDYPEMGGGTYFEFYEKVEELDCKAEEILKGKHVLFFAGEISHQYEYVPIEYITKIERKR